MRYVRKDNGDETTLRIEGTLDAISAPELRAEVERIVQEVRPVVRVDLGALRLIDSSGVGVVVWLYKRVRAQGGQVTIEGLRDQPRAVFRLLRLDRVFTGLEA